MGKDATANGTWLSPWMNDSGASVPEDGPAAGRPGGTNTQIKGDASGQGLQPLHLLEGLHRLALAGAVADVRGVGRAAHVLFLRFRATGGADHAHADGHPGPRGPRGLLGVDLNQ